MLVKILGGIDIVSGLILLSGAGIKIPHMIPLVFGIVLLVKSLFGMFKELGSWIDISTGIILILSSFFAMPIFISIIFAVLILQKGAVSFL